MFPLTPGAKTPATRHGFRDATTDPGQIERWAAQFPGCNWGMANGHVFDVIDLDGDTGEASALEHFGGSLPGVLGWVKTPGGVHGYVPVTGRKRRPGALPKVDLLGAGGYVVLPGSVLDDGRRYQWLTAPADPGRGIDLAPWCALWDHGKAPTAPEPATAVVGPTDPGRARAYAATALEGIRADLDAAKDWDEGETDGHGRGWEKLIADAAHAVGRLARTEGSGITMATGLDVLNAVVPGDMAAYVNIVEKWRQQGTRGEAHMFPDPFAAMGLNTPTPGAPAAPSGAVVDRRRVMGAMHAQAQFADGLAASSSHRHMYVPGIGWHYYDGKRWREDTDNARVLRALRDLLERTAAANIDNADVLRAVRATSSATQMEGVLRIARASSEFVRDVDDLDADAYALNVANGTLDLRTFELRPHDPTDGITKVSRASWHPGNDWRGSRWAAFLEEVLPDAEVRAYLQRYVGLALLGEVLEHKLAVLTGTGRNGKGVLYGAVSWALGDYAVSAEPDLFMHREGAHPTGQLDLRGARWVIVSETESGRRLADATVKRLTGGDAIRARRMGKDFVQFEPSHTAAMVTNHLPRVSADDPAMWSRLRVVPFDVVIPDAVQDSNLAAKLKAEADAVLSWAVEGLRDYYTRGMSEPEAVKVATDAYREDNDLLAEFLEQNTQQCTGVGVQVTELHTRYAEWCRARRVEPEGRKTLSEALKRRGLKSVKTNRGVCWSGLALTGFQMHNPLSEADSAVSAVFPAPPVIPSYAEGASRTAQTAHGADSAPPGSTTETPGLTPEQAAILHRLSTTNTEGQR